MPINAGKGYVSGKPKSSVKLVGGSISSMPGHMRKPSVVKRTAKKRGGKK